MPDDLQEEFDSLQAMHDKEHRREVELEKERYAELPQNKKLREHLELLADAAALPSEHFTRCLGCGASVRMDLEACPICATKLVDAA